MPELFISVDIEADGPIPGEYSMLSLGAVAFNEHRHEVGSWQSNFYTLEGAGQHPDTMDFWSKNEKAYTYTRQNLRTPDMAMRAFHSWLTDLKSFGDIVFVGYPATYDFMWVHWYLVKFTSGDPFGFAGLDMKSMAYQALDLPWKRCHIGNFPEDWTDELKGSHYALDDAQKQGQMFFRIKESRSD